MKLPKTIRNAALTLFTLATAAMMPAGVAMAATVQMEGAIYAKNVTQGTAYSHAGTSAKAGETVGFEVYYHNLESPDSGKVASNVRIKVNLPTDTSTSHVVSATIKADNSNQVNDSTTVTTNVATTLNFKSDVAVTWRHNTGTNANPNWVTQNISSDVVTNPNGAVVDAVELPCNNFAGTIAFQATLTGGEKPQTPIYTCDAFSITADVNRTVKISTFSTTATNGAVFKNASVNWGDNSIGLTNANIVGQTHQYAADGTYIVTATAHFTVNGEDVTASGPNCEKSVTFTSGQPPKVTPPTPTPQTPATLVNTGAGSVVGIFAAATAAGAAAYRFVLARRLTRQ